MRSRSHRSRGRHRRSTWGIGPRRPPSRGYYPMRRQSRGNVRVVGCCLPIPIGVMVLGLMLRGAIVRGGR